MKKKLWRAAACGLTLTGLAVGSEVIAVPVPEAGAGQPKSDSARPETDEYGKLSYSEYRARVLRDAASWRDSMPFSKAMGRFEQADDHEAMLKLAEQLNPQLIGSGEEQWSQLIDMVQRYSMPKNAAAVIFRKVPDACLPKLNLYQSFFPKQQIPQYADIIRRFSPVNPECFFEEVEILDQGRPDAIEREVARWKKADWSTRDRILSNLKHLDSYYGITEGTAEKEKLDVLRKRHLPARQAMLRLLDLVDYSNPLEEIMAIEFAESVREFNRAADMRIAQLNKPVTREEMRRNCSTQRMLTEAESKEECLAHRRTRLLSDLLEAGRTQEAQKYAEQFFGPSADLSKMSREMFYAGMTQMRSGARVIEKKLSAPEAAPDSPAGSIRLSQYYYGRSELEKAEAALDAGIRKARKDGDAKSELFLYVAQYNLYRDISSTNMKWKKQYPVAKKIRAFVLAHPGLQLAPYINIRSESLGWLLRSLPDGKNKFNTDLAAALSEELAEGNVCVLCDFPVWMYLKADDPALVRLTGDQYPLTYDYRIKAQLTPPPSKELSPVPAESTCTYNSFRDSVLVPWAIRLFLCDSAQMEPLLKQFSEKVKQGKIPDDRVWKIYSDLYEILYHLPGVWWPDEQVTKSRARAVYLAAWILKHVHQGTEYEHLKLFIWNHEGILNVTPIPPARCQELYESSFRLGVIGEDEYLAYLKSLVCNTRTSAPELSAALQKKLELNYGIKF